MEIEVDSADFDLVYALFHLTYASTKTYKFRYIVLKNIH